MFERYSKFLRNWCASLLWLIFQMRMRKTTTKPKNMLRFNDDDDGNDTQNGDCDVDDNVDDDDNELSQPLFCVWRLISCLIVVSLFSISCMPGICIFFVSIFIFCHYDFYVIRVELLHFSCCMCESMLRGLCVTRLSCLFLLEIMENSWNKIWC